MVSSPTSPELPLNIGLASPDLQDGAQRPDLTGDPLGSNVRDAVHGKDVRFNVSNFAQALSQHVGPALRYLSCVRDDSVRNLDLALFKVLSFRERYKLQLRAEAFNFTNTVRFGDPDTAFGSPTFGVINGQSNSPRRVQMGARFLF